jgi:hypothetical protein
MLSLQRIQDAVPAEDTGYCHSRGYRMLSRQRIQVLSWQRIQDDVTA